MSTIYKIRKAHAIIESLPRRELGALTKICRVLQSAQDDLIRIGNRFFHYCYQHCGGRCCNNIHVDDLLTLLDFIYILTLNPALLDKITACAREETLYTGNCFFLEGGSGPCIFPPNQKPERCIITFCQDTGPLKNEIRMIRGQFSRIFRFTALRRPIKVFGF